MIDLKQFLSQYDIILANGDEKNFEIKRTAEELKGKLKLDADVVVLIREDVTPTSYLALLKKVTSYLRTEFIANERILHNAAVRNATNEFQEEWS